MSSLFNIGAGPDVGQGATEIANFRVQTSVYGRPIPIIYGRSRIATNLIAFMDFTATPTTTQQPGSKVAGVVPVGGGTVFSGYIYTAAAALALCEGPVVQIGSMWKNKEGPITFGTFGPLFSGWGLVTGTSSQSAWSYTTSHHPSEAVPYQFTAYLTNPTLQLPNATMDSYSWEVYGFLPFNSPSIEDASVAAVIEDFLTAAQYGVGFPSAKLDATSLATFKDYVAAFSLFASPAVADQREARQYMDEWLEIGNTAAVWSDGVLKFRPYGDTAKTANGHTYTPNTTPVYDLTDNDYLPRGENESPVIIRRRNPVDIPNVVTVEVEDGAYDYNPVPVVAEDLFDEITNGKRPLPVISLRAIKDPVVGRVVAQTRLQREQGVRNTYECLLGLKYSLLEPMDLLTLTETTQGLSLTPVRVTEMIELEGEQGFQVLAEDYPPGTASASLYGSQGANGYAPDTGVAPGNASVVIIEAPVAIQQTPLDLYIGATGGANWGGCDVYVSYDNTAFTWIARIGQKAALGTISANLASTSTVYPSVDNVNTLSVNISGSSGRTLVSYSSTDFDALAPLCYVGGSTVEWLAYKTATATGTGLYDLTSLYRALYASTAGTTHSSGAPFLFIDGAVLPLSFPNVAAGQVIYFKFPSFNQFGNGLQDISTLTATSYTFTRDPLPTGGDIPQATVSNNADGSYAISVDGASWMKSFKWAVSTSAFPSDTTALAGTTSNGRQIVITGAAAALTLGQTIYATLIPFSATGAAGYRGQSIHARGTYQDFAATKTVYMGASGFTPDPYSLNYYIIIDGVLEPFNVGTVPPAPAPGIVTIFVDDFQLPAGCTITSVAAECYSDDTGNGAGKVYVEFTRTDGAGTSSLLGSDTANAGTGWVTKTLSMSEATNAGRRYQMKVEFETVFTGEEDHSRFGGYSVTYTVPSSANTL